MNIRNAIISRLAVIYFLMLILGVVVVFKLLAVQNIKTDRWKQIADNLSNNTVVIEPIRGNICADDGNVLATSVPGYYVRIDLAAQGVKRQYAEKSDSLALMLSRFFKNASPKEYKRRLDAAYRNSDRGFMLTPRKIDYNELQVIKNFPILRKGTFGGGRIIIQENKRVLPLGKLAARTIGTLNKGAGGGTKGDVGNTGIEGSFETYLKGEEGVAYRQNLSGRWLDRIEIEPKDGMDVITTLNIRMQDITESALERQLKASNAEWGTAVLMEVKTGEIKAIANLGRVAPGHYEEVYNYALGHAGCYEPGSTFKLISLLIALDQAKVDTSDVFDTGSGVWKYHDRTIYDSDYKYGGHGPISVKRIFELSSNVGVAKIITSAYEKNPKEYVDRIYELGLNKPLGLEVMGEGVPFFKYPGNKDWWGTTLAWMSYGYEIKMTPLQMLAFYNAVANDGKMVKPRLIKEIREKGALRESYKTEVIHSRIFSRRTIRQAQSMLEGVCENGTGKSLRNDVFKIAGKTGTAQISSGQSGYGKGLYLASFAGYFPADDPLYSMIVTINKPQGAYYGGSVAGPVFAEVAEKVYAYLLQGKGKPEETPGEEIAPAVKSGMTHDLLQVLDELNVDTDSSDPDTDVAKVKREDNNLILEDFKVSDGVVPDVRGMGASNAVYLLENAGLRVRISGVGKVKSQSIPAGRKFKKGQTILLTLG